MSDRMIDSMYRYRSIIIGLLHVVLVLLANRLAFWLRFEGDTPAAQRPYDTSLLPLLVFVRLTLIAAFRLNQGVWRYTSISDLRNIILAVGISTAIFWFATHLVLDITVYPRSIFIIDSILLIILMGGVRLARRLYDMPLATPKGRRVLVFGAGNAGEMIVRDMLQNPQFDASPIGFLDDDKHKVGQRIHDLPVLGGRDDIARILQSHRPDELLIAMPSASRDNLRGIVRALDSHKIRITTLPGLQDLMGSRVEVEQIRQLKVEDLLTRDPIRLDAAPIRAFLENKRVMVTGAGGSIGSELCRQVGMAGPESLVMLDRYENGLFEIHRELERKVGNNVLLPVIADITDASRISQIFGRTRPQVVFHAAAHKHVPLMEANPCEAVKNNIRGTRIAAEAAIAHGVDRFVLISTDKAVNPASIMGCTKKVAELLIMALNQSSGTRFTAVRFGNVLGSNGSVVPTFMAQIASGGPVTVTHPEMRRYFMSIREAVQLVLHAGALPDDAPLFVLDMGEPVKVAEMARDLIRLSGFVPDKDVEVQFTGIRPGEKLIEELVGMGEFGEPSSLVKVLKVTSAIVPDPQLIFDSVGRLEKFAADGQTASVVSELRALVTECTLSISEALQPRA